MGWGSRVVGRLSQPFPPLLHSVQGEPQEMCHPCGHSLEKHRHCLTSGGGGGYIEREDSRRSGGATGSSALSCHLALPFQGCPGRSRQGQWQQHSRVGSTGSAPGWEGVLTPPCPEAISVLGEPGWLAFLNVEAHFSPGHTCKYTSPSLCVCDPGTPHSSEAMETACA